MYVIYWFKQKKTKQMTKKEEEKGEKKNKTKKILLEIFDLLTLSS